MYSEINRGAILEESQVFLRIAVNVYIAVNRSLPAYVVHLCVDAFYARSTVLRTFAIINISNNLPNERTLHKTLNSSYTYSRTRFPNYLNFTFLLCFLICIFIKIFFLIQTLYKYKTLITF